jgi:hypothetical protein
MEIYQPAYLFQGSRPSIGSAPASITWNQQFAVSTSQPSSIALVSLVRMGAVTHSFNTDQRLIELPFTAGSTTLNVTSPPTANIAPPGYYMLFIVNTSGVPSVASIVQLH